MMNLDLQHDGGARYSIDGGNASRLMIGRSSPSALMVERGL